MTASALAVEIRRIWRKFLVDREFARNYTLAHLDQPGLAANNPVPERLLPSLLHIKAVAILDHAFNASLEERGLRVPRKPYGMDLYGRINYLADNGYIGSREFMHSLGDTRNDIAHEPAEEVAWEGVDRASVRGRGLPRSTSRAPVDILRQFEQTLTPRDIIRVARDYNDPAA